MNRKSNIEIIVFDLDGTLTESEHTITNATKYTLDTLGIKGTFDSVMFSGMIGHHFPDIFTKMKLDVPDFGTFLTTFKAKYFDYISDTVLYPGVTDVLKKLKEAGYKLALLTTKGQDQADLIIDHFELRKYFNYVMGRREGVPIKPDPESLYIIADYFEKEKSDILMVGDTEMDIECARNAGSVSCGVTYGYRDKVILAGLNPDFLIDDINELLKITGV